ncbi:MAG: XTP/dITP diphosphatase [Deltaproteobacteria bacterium]|nr:XTP/dITP diphosphatase [Deltaproteobacteria bacterium]
MEIVIASNNKGKIEEIKNYLSDKNIIVFSLEDYPDFPGIIEDGKTYFENAFKKAHAVCQYTGKIAIADDSGLEIEALNKAPGVYSSRYAGPQAGASDNIKKVLEELKKLPQDISKKATFKCVISIVHPNGNSDVIKESCEGEMILKPRGNNGFGYDPIFFIPLLNCTMAELTLAKKNEISHRGKAMKRLKELLPKYIK